MVTVGCVFHQPFSDPITLELTGNLKSCLQRIKQYVLHTLEDTAKTFYKDIKNARLV